MTNKRKKRKNMKDNEEKMTKEWEEVKPKISVKRITWREAKKIWWKTEKWEGIQPNRQIKRKVKEI